MSRLWRIPTAFVLTVVGCLLSALADSSEEMIYQPARYAAREAHQRRMLRELWDWALGRSPSFPAVDQQVDKGPGQV